MVNGGRLHANSKTRFHGHHLFLWLFFILSKDMLLILLYLAFLSAPWNTLALPTDLQSSQKFPTNHLQSIFIRDEGSKFDSRSIYAILWSCLSTIFTCTWIAVHPNIPAPGDSQWAVFRRRMAIMGYTLLVPELIMLWAWRQHNAAHNFAKKHHENTGWTPVHAFFLIMGGFTLHKGGKPVRVMEVKDLEELSGAGKIEWPTITKEEIEDRSKRDYLSKTIVLFQTTWFIGQCISRGAYGLAVTELEVVTLAFAALNGIIYYFWWDKPVDVRCSIPVHLLEDDVEKHDTSPQETSAKRVQEGDENIVTLPNPHPSTLVQSEQEIPEGEENIVVLPNSLLSTPVQLAVPTPDSAVTISGSNVISPLEFSDRGMPRGEEVIVNSSTSIQVDTSTGTPNPDPALTRTQRFQDFRRRACAKHGTLLGLGYVFLFFPLSRVLVSSAKITNSRTLGDKILRVPTFYSAPDNLSHLTANISTLCVSTVLGAIHCIAWSFHFATFQEQWAWRISAILVLCLPIPYMAFRYHRMKHRARLTLMLLYIIARITLLILCFAGLRALSPGAYVQINWVSFLPHI